MLLVQRLFQTLITPPSQRSARLAHDDTCVQAFGSYGENGKSNRTRGAHGRTAESVFHRVDMAEYSTESAIPAGAAAAIFALLGGPISVEHLGWDPAAAGDLITAFACPFTNFGALLAVN